MDNIYQVPKNYVINVERAVEVYVNKLQKNSKPKTDDELKEAIGFKGTDSEFQSLLDSVSLDKVETGAEQIKDFDLATYDKKRIDNLVVPDTALQLNTTKAFLKYRENMTGGKTFNEIPFTKPEYQNKFVRNNFTPPQAGDEIIEPLTDCILYIRVYRPYYYSKSKPTYGPPFQAEFLVLGSQYLTVLKDKIDCMFNNYRIVDISENPDQEFEKQPDSAGFFFITNTFYDDTRDPNNPILSTKIKTWLSTKDFKEVELHTAKMEDTKFTDLHVRLGFPQVYRHNGKCEHLFCISRIEIITAANYLKKSDYPICRSVGLPKYHLCYICGKFRYEYIVEDSNKHVMQPAFLCEKCLKHFHYIDGKKVGEFKAFKVCQKPNMDECEVTDSDSDSDNSNISVNIAVQTEESADVEM